MTAGNRLVVASALCLSLELSRAAVLREGPNDDHTEAFHQYMEKYSRPYQKGSSEYHQRLALFGLRRSDVEAQNSRPGRLWTATINKFSDRSKAELAQLSGWRGGAARTSVSLLRGSDAVFRQQGSGRTVPTEFMDWTNLRSAVSSDQGSCGSCWAVATAKMLHLHHEIYSPNKNRTFSAQELVSCVPNPQNCGGDGGCGGATVELALNWVLNEGLDNSSETPYEAATTSCKKNVNAGGLVQLPAIGMEEVTRVGIHAAPHGARSASFGMVAWERLPVNKYKPVLQALYERGPLGMSVAARGWFSYAGGVFDRCSEEWVISHAVVLVGYGKDTETGTLFYSIQNSWGPDWGEHGRIRIIRHDNDEELCGTDHQPEVGTGCDGGPSQVRVCGPCGLLYDNAVPHFKNATS